MGCYAAAWDGDEDPFPEVGTEEGGRGVGILEVKKGGREGLEGGCGGGGEVNQL